MRTLDLKECAEFLKIHKETAQILAASGKLPGAKIGRAWIFIEDDLIAYIRGEVQQQQNERLRNKKPEKPPVDIAKIDVLAGFSAIRNKPRGRRTPLPTLPDLPEFVG